MTDWMAELCQRVGVGLEYHSFSGQTARPARETLIGVLAALGFDITAEGDAEDHVRRLDAEAARRPLPEEIVLPHGAPSEFRAARPASWAVTQEATDAVIASGDADDLVRLPALPLGVHRLTLRAEGASWTTWLIARPERCISVADVTGDVRIWGVTAPLYGMTDGAAAELGDYALLSDYAAGLARHGTAFVGINPVHAMGQNPPDGLISPYSPSHRAFLNTWHIATESHPSARSDLIDYPAAIAARERALAAEFDAFLASAPQPSEREAFDRFRREGGAALQEFALFEALAARHGGGWRDWPAPYRLKDEAALDAFARDEAQAITFHIWAQFRADRQMTAARNKARDAGMGVGLYLDLAVGPRPDGAETWAAGSPLATGATLGAPPDPLCPAGQSWGIAPLSPQRCRDDGYAGFAQLLRAVMRHAGMIRIDHALGLMRAFWIPEGATEGAYVSHRLESLLAIIAIESVRSRCIVIGEDLGLVPAGLREALAGCGIYGLDVLQYMRRHDGGFEEADGLRSKAIAAFSTHDTPTVKGFFAANDAEAQVEIGMIDADALPAIRDDRNRARASLGDGPATDAVHRRLAHGPSEMVAIQLDDIAGVETQQNLPGTTTEHPNWRRRVPMALGDLDAAPALAGLAAEMRAAGRANHNELETVDDC